MLHELDDVRNAVYRRADRLGFPSWYGCAGGMAAWSAFTAGATRSMLDGANGELARMETDRTHAARYGSLATLMRLDRAERARMRPLPRGPQPRRKGQGKPRGVVCVETGKPFETMTEARLAVGRTLASLQKALAEGTKCGGYHWRFVDDAA